MLLLAAASLAGAGLAQPPTSTSGAAAKFSLRAPDVPYEPTAPEVVQAMLRLAKVQTGDVVYDLGCGDGRIVIAAARQFDTRGVCVDIDPERIAEARENARQAGVADRIEFRNTDLFVTRIAEATVVMLFLYPEINLKLRPRLLSELKPGTRVVSHWHHMGDWVAQQTVRVSSGNREHPVYLWIIP
jgi:predicted O-methyltransferase YrrM